MSDPNINIGINTTGADAAVADLNKVKGASESVTKGQLGAGNSLGPRDDAGRERAIRDVQSLSDKAKVAEIAYYNLGDALDQDFKKIVRGTDAAATSVQKLGRQGSNASDGLRKTGFVANQVSMQVGDFTQQITGGTSVMRAFSQQAPQLIGTFTSLGMVTGAAGMALMGVAVALPIVTQAGSAFIQWLDNGAEKARKASEEVSGLGEKISEIQTKHLDKFKEKLEESKTHAANLKTDMKGLRAAESEAAQAILDNAGKMATAEQKINVILGIRVDHFTKIKEANELARKQRENDLATAQQKAAEDRKKKEDELADLRKQLEASSATYQREKDARERRLARIPAMEENRAKQEKIAQEGPGVLDWLDSPVYAIEAQSRAADAQSEYTRLDNTIGEEKKGAAKNQKELDGFARGIRELESQINGLEKQLLVDQKAAETSLDTLIKTQETSKVVELADTAKKYQEDITSTAVRMKTDLEAAAAIQGSLTAPAASSLAIITKQLENGVIDPNELQQFSTAMALAKSSREAVKNQILGSYAEVLASDRETREAMKAMQLQYQEMMRR